MLDQKSGQAAQKGQKKTFKACLRFQLQAPLAPCPGLPAHQRLLFQRQYFHMHLPVEGVAELATNQVCASLSPAPPDPRVFNTYVMHAELHMSLSPLAALGVGVSRGVPADPTVPTSRLAKFTRAFDARTIDMDNLRRICWSGIPRQLRAFTWQLLLVRCLLLTHFRCVSSRLLWSDRAPP